MRKMLEGVRVVQLANFVAAADGVVTKADAVAPTGINATACTTADNNDVQVQYLSGIGKQKDGLITLLNISSVINEKESA